MFAWVRPATRRVDDAAGEVLKTSQKSMSRAHRLDRALGLSDSSRSDAFKALLSSSQDPIEKRELRGLLACVEADCVEHDALALKVKSALAEGVSRSRANLAGEQKARTQSEYALLLVLALGALVMAGAYLRPSHSTDERNSESEDDSSLLEETLRERLEQLYSARKRVRENARFASFGEVAAGLSHGLKTPLACVRAATQVAQAKIDDDHAAQSNLDDVIDEVDGLVDQVNRFLMTMGNGDPILEELEPRTLLTPLDERYRNGIVGRKISWRLDVSDDVASVLGDPELIEMALRNLIDNAFQASDADSEVCLLLCRCPAPARVGIDAEPPAPWLLEVDWVEIAVTDQGPGIGVSATNREAVESTKSGGSGLGIAIARRIAARLGGALELARREDDRGTRASFILPPKITESESGEST